MTIIKLAGVIGVTIVGFLIATGFTAPLLGTNANGHPVPCSENDPTMGPCLSSPGFGCLSQLVNLLKDRLEGNVIQADHLDRRLGLFCWIYELHLPGYTVPDGQRNGGHYG